MSAAEIHLFPSFFFFKKVISTPSVGLELHDPKTKSCQLSQLGQPGAPASFHLFCMGDKAPVVKDLHRF